MKRVLPILLMLALMAFGVALIPGAVGKLKDIRLEETRVELPGQRTVDLDARKYVVWLETRGGNLTKFDGTPSDVPAEIRPADGGAALPLSDYAGSFTTESGGREAAALATVTPPKPGEYIIGGPSTQMVPNPSVVLGYPTRGAVLRIVVGIVLAVIGLIGAIVGVILAIVLPRKDKDEAQTPVAGGDPFDA